MAEKIFQWILFLLLATLTLALILKALIEGITFEVIVAGCLLLVIVIIYLVINRIKNKIAPNGAFYFLSQRTILRKIDIIFLIFIINSKRSLKIWRIGIMEISEKIIVALDNMNEVQAIDLAEKLEGLVWGFKINDLFVSAGPEIIQELNPFGEICLDLKFHDIRTTVANYAKKIARMSGVKMFTIHASGGLEMMKEAVKNKENCDVFAVVVLDSLTSEDCRRIYGTGFREKFIQLAREAKEARVDGIICPGGLLETLNSIPDLKGLRKIAVGIRSLWALNDEHIYPVTPEVAIKAGAYKLIIGRPITNPTPEIGGPVNAVKRIAGELKLSKINKNNSRFCSC